MSTDESLDVSRIYSVSDLLPSDVPLIRERPFRSPHNTISYAGLVGGGNWPRPGEISLAHRGVLFLDELPEFGMRTLELLRQPMEDREVTISRARGSYSFPDNFMLVGAMNPWACSYFVKGPQVLHICKLKRQGSSCSMNLPPGWIPSQPERSKEPFNGLKIAIRSLLVPHSVQQAARTADHAAFILEGELIEFTAGEEDLHPPA